MHPHNWIINLGVNTAHNQPPASSSYSISHQTFFPFFNHTFDPTHLPLSLIKVFFINTTSKPSPTPPNNLKLPIIIPPHQ